MSIAKNILEIKQDAVEDFDFYLGLSILLFAFDKFYYGLFCLVISILCATKRGWK